ncbi:MAG: alpha-ketoglutarate-dependent dioxygenase AlkB [Proteobacteria bacterium]|nr:alpha-ketoglutarate-dependent dioxygenase AlkB [Pseudomonadota bacterium]
MSEKRSIGHGAWIRVIEDFLPPSEADDALDALLAELAWEQRSNVVFGKEVLQPRLCAWAGAIPYKFSGQTLEARAPTPTLAALSERVLAEVPHPFNHVVVNHYRNGRDWIAKHADNERELGYRPLIAAVSLGATRRFDLLRKKGRRLVKLQLTHGSLLVMGGSCQHTWRHQLPKQAAVTEPRLNLTWRQLMGPPGWKRDWESDPNRREPRGESSGQAAVTPRV